MRRVLAAILAAVALASPGFAADAVFPAGSRIGLVPPKTMTPSRGVSGFHDPATGAAIVAIEMPVEAYAPMVAGFAEETLKAQGFTVGSRDAVKVGTSDGLLLTGEQNDGGRAVPKVILLAGAPTLTALVIAQAPVGAPPALRDELKEALRTVAIRPPLSIEEQIGALPFRMGDTAGFRPIRAMAGNALLLTDGPEDVVKAASQPVLIVAQSLVPAPPVEQRDAFSRTLLAANTLLKEVVFERSQGFRQGGSDWHEIVAKAKDAQSDEPVVVMQTIRFEPGGYLRMVGLARIAQRDDVLGRFRRAVDSVVLR